MLFVKESGVVFTGHGKVSSDSLATNVNVLINI